MNLKNYTSRPFKGIAGFYLGFPIFYLLSAAVFFDIPGRGLADLLLSPSYFLVCAVCVSAGWGLWEMRRWAWYVFLFATGMILYQNIRVLTTLAETHHKVLSFVMSSALLLGLAWQIRREVRVPYFLPRIPWWESTQTRSVIVSALLERIGASASVGQILDISLSGCFIKTKDGFSGDESVIVKFNVFGQEIDAPGRVVWMTDGGVTHPRGVGVKFNRLDRRQRRRLRVALQRLKRVNALYRRGHSQLRGTAGEDIIQSLDEFQVLQEETTR